MNISVTVVGSCNTDLISYVPRLPKQGETIQGSRFSMGFGGKGANQCVMAARLGAKAAMVAKVGADTFGENFIKNFKDNGINRDFVTVTDQSTTGVAPICVEEAGQNSIVIVPGANLLLSEEDVYAAKSLITSSKVVICQLEINPQTTLAALKLAKKFGVLTIFNPAPGLANLDTEFYTYSDIICPNETEAEILTGLPVKSIEDAKMAANILLKRGCGKVIITLGEQGSVIATTDTSEVKHVPAQKVKVVDTTGAGDAFIGSLAFYLAENPHLGLEESVRRATILAGISVQSPGTQTSMPWASELDPKILS
ncbi:hypothetical protein CHS0354_039736 [Potamilus streckersoni]|uniref:Ribokinase n=1 Tax=Potamilus streckersoni TaxID=2493646 RepID=A0AAE0VGY4_9BIVA|nr:hypothetical protein CHS0354_039736 [Potamilus streckersoni]